VKWMKRIKYLDARDVRTQGIVGDDVTILTFTVSFRRAESHPTTRLGSLHPIDFFCQSRR
jgi:hypothetical protein